MKDKILFSSGCLIDQNSGPYLSLKQTVSALKAEGHKVAVVGTKKNTNSLPLDWSVDAIAFNRYGPNSLHFAPKLSGWLKRHSKHNWDVASMQGVWLYTNHLVANWCIKNSTPFLLTPHGAFNPIALGYSSYKKFLAKHSFLRNVFNNVSCYQALSESEYKILREFGIRTPISIIGNGINIPDIDPLLPEYLIDSELRKRRTCLYLGRLFPIKGVERLITAWSNIMPSDDWQLIIAGGGESNYVDKLKTLALQLKCKNIIFIGPIYGDLKKAWLTFAEILALTSYSEGFPVAILEGFSYSKPALLTRECGLGGSSFSSLAATEVEGTQEAINMGLTYMLSLSQEQLMNMGANGYNNVVESHSWARIAKQLSDSYAWLRGGKMPETIRLY